jgi:hypothetical protein
MDLVAVAGLEEFEELIEEEVDLDCRLVTQPGARAGPRGVVVGGH